MRRIPVPGTSTGLGRRPHQPDPPASNNGPRVCRRLFVTGADTAIAVRVDVLGAVKSCVRRRTPDGNVRDPELMIGDAPIMVSVNVPELGPTARIPGGGNRRTAAHRRR